MAWQAFQDQVPSKESKPLDNIELLFPAIPKTPCVL
jgi:hypothetical protein